MRGGCALVCSVVVERKGGRRYLAPSSEQEQFAQLATDVLASEGDQDLPTQKCRGTFGSNAQGRRYGFVTFCDYYSPRQLLAAVTFSNLVLSVRDEVLKDALKSWVGSHFDDRRPVSENGLGPVAYADTISTLMSIVLARMHLYGSSLCKWLTKDNAMASAMAQKGIEMAFDYAEGNPFSKSSADIVTCSDAVAACLEQVHPVSSAAIDVRDAAISLGVDHAVIATDPPYLDNVSYADLSDYFYVWHRRSLRSVWPNLFRRLLTPKAEKIIADKYRHGGDEAAAAFFMNGMKATLRLMAGAEDGEYPLTVFYAYKQSDNEGDGHSSTGWSAFPQAVVDARLVVDGTWPLRTELTAALKQNVNSLASSSVLVCRRRDTGVPTITRSDFLRALRREMPGALSEISQAGVGPTDIHQAAIGPGIGVFSRYSQVLNTDGTPMSVKDALKLINQVREEITSHSDADYDSETRFALDWFAAKGFDKGRSGDAITMTNAVNISLDGMNAAGFFEARGGDARLLKRDELPDKWAPASDNRGTVWEACQHLIKRLTAEDGGIEAAAVLYNRLGALAEPAHSLARRLYEIADRKIGPAEANYYKRLDDEWSAIEKRAAVLAEVSGVRDLFSR
jgi:putative DNA methylase